MKTGQVRASGSPWGAQAGGTWRVRCSDGRLRIATITAEADTFFTLPARVQVRGRTVTGSVYYDSETEEFRFSAYTYRKNADALPKWSE